VPGPAAQGTHDHDVADRLKRQFEGAPRQFRAIRETARSQPVYNPAAMAVPLAPMPPTVGTAPIFCSLIPREILEIAGLKPIEIRPSEEPDLAGGYACALCDNICSWARHLIGRLAATDYSAIVVPASCDAMTKLHDALRVEGAAGRLFRLDVPRRDDAAGIRYLAGQYRQLLAALGVTDANFEEAMKRRAGAQIADSGTAPAVETQSGVRVGIAGSVFPEGIFVRSLQSAGAQVHLLRRCGMPVPRPLPSDLFEADGVEHFCTRLATHYLRAAVCPRMMGTAFADFLAVQVAGRRLAGLVVPVLKFCDGYHLAVERLKGELPPGFPILLVEGDLTTGFGEQTVTRLEAFVETLRDAGPHGTRSPAGAVGSRMAVGVDVGSTQVKAVLMDANHRLACTFIRPTTARMTESSADAMAQLLRKAGIARGDVSVLGVTGYGRKSVASDAMATEISCHARGVNRFFPEPATVIDVGGQDSKVIVTDRQGRVVRFTMNDKCAAGTGRFIFAMVRALDLDFGGFSTLSLGAEAEVPVTSMCSVFAESEVISLSARGESTAGIARGINASIARRVAGMVRRIDGVPPFVLTGGVSQILGFVRELERELDAPVRVFEHALHAGAIGAALLALENA
jgi:predicted CoA-substrate-specific enzyme activase